MKVLFCRISSMKFYKGACPEDPPFHGGGFVEKNGFGHEEFNFTPFCGADEKDRWCMGFVEPMSTRGKTNTMHIERIEGCADLKDEEFIEDVLVIWCATREQGDITVVGWYKHATVWRTLQDWIKISDDGTEEERCYNVEALASDCTLLPSSKRNNHVWRVPTAKYTKSFGFGQSMVWYPTEEAARPFVTRLVENINWYHDKNDLDVYPKEN